MRIPSFLQFINEHKRYYKTIKLTSNLIDKYKNRDNMLIHLENDVDGVAIMNNNDLVGYVGYKNEWIKGIWVDSKYRRKHLGSKLLDYAVRNGANHSSINHKNEVSLDFHKKNGFRIYDSDDNMKYLIKNKEAED